MATLYAPFPSGTANDPDADALVLSKLLENRLDRFSCQRPKGVPVAEETRDRDQEVGEQGLYLLRFAAEVVNITADTVMT
jgi:hypothetical protein